ncbi:MAG: dihydroneopterin aldolase [Pseudomonadota bacterium]
MPTETHLAFAHPEERSAASAPEQDRIAVRDLVLEAEIGAFQAERGVTQRLRFDVVVEVAPLPADLADDVDRILSYDRITEAIHAALAEERLNLLETLAERVAEGILTHDQARKAFVRVAKLDRGPGTLGVEIVRRRAEAAPTVVDDVPRPVVLALGAGAIRAPHLSGWIDQLAGAGAPVVIAVGAPDVPAPDAGHVMAQRRIDLLAMEQNAWVLAGRDARCVVVGTRTELDWGMRHGQISSWAPSKMVLDAVDAPAGLLGTPGALIAWFAAELDAQRVVAIGIDVAQGATPVLTVAADSATL